MFGGADGEVVCTDLNIRRGRRLVLDDVYLSLSPGVTGLLGPNGAGKTTLLSVIATALPVPAGHVWVRGNDLGSSGGRVAAQPLLGYLPQRFDLLTGSTLLENVRFSAWAKGIAKRECDTAAVRALEIVGLTGRSSDRAGKLSGGMRQRLGIACAIVHDPPILLLDEPTAALDPAQRIEVRRYLQLLSSDRTVLVSTHIVEDMALSADRICVLSDGRIVFDGTAADLEGRADGIEANRHVSRIEQGYLSVMAEAS